MITRHRDEPESLQSLVQWGELLKAIAHPVRLRMVAGLCRHNCNVNSIARRLGLPQSTVSQHLALLRNKGILAASKQGTSTCYAVVDARIAKILEVLGVSDKQEEDK